MDKVNTYNSEQTNTIYGIKEFSQATTEYGGTRRLPYLGITIGLGIVYIFVLTTLISLNNESAIYALVLYNIILLIPAYYRIKNIGFNPWWCLLKLIPIVNGIVGICCLVLQEGYVATKKLDSSGKTTLYIFIGFIVLVVILELISFN